MGKLAIIRGRKPYSAGKIDRRHFLCVIGVKKSSIHLELCRNVADVKPRKPSNLGRILLEKWHLTSVGAQPYPCSLPPLDAFLWALNIYSYLIVYIALSL